MIATGKAVPKLQLEHGLAVDRVYTGSFMTSLDMAGLLSHIITFFFPLNYNYNLLKFHFPFLSGFSISIMKADPAILQRLDASTKAPYWPVAADGLHMLDLFSSCCHDPFYLILFFLHIYHVENLKSLFSH